MKGRLRDNDNTQICNRIYCLHNREKVAPDWPPDGSGIQALFISRLPLSLRSHCHLRVTEEEGKYGRCACFFWPWLRTLLFRVYILLVETCHMNNLVARAAGKCSLWSSMTTILKWGILANSQPFLPKDETKTFKSENQKRTIHFESYGIIWK